MIVNIAMRMREETNMNFIAGRRSSNQDTGVDNIKGAARDDWGREGRAAKERLNWSARATVGGDVEWLQEEHSCMWLS